MIGKISKSGSFKKLVEYLDKEDAVVLGTNMYGQGSRELTAEFMAVRDLNPGIKQPVLHASLSLLPGESLSDEQFREACEKWIEKMGFDLNSNQYLIIRHKDTEHEHAHLAINRIDMISSKVVVDSFERYRSQEIIRQLERNYDLEPVAPSWQTYRNYERELEHPPELSERQQLAVEIERAAQGSPTMPEFFHRLVERQIRAEVGFTRNGKPKGIIYKMVSGEKVAGNALGKAYSFPGLQKYLKVNYEEARDNRELAEIVQSTRQHYQKPQQAGAPAREDLELQTSQPQMKTVVDPPQSERKKPPIWEPQYGIPAIQDLIKAIPENIEEPQAEIPDLAHGQRKKAQAAYQQWSSLARTIYQVGELKAIDHRIAFLMQEGQQSTNQIAQVLAQSPAVQELLKRDRTYTQSYSEFCQSYARDNQATWQIELDQYRSSGEIERQRQEQQRIAKERQLIQQQEQQHNLKLLGQWHSSAIALGKPASYVERIREVTADHQRGIPLSEKTIAARQQDLAAYQRQIQMQRQQGGLSL
ncbi:relaxase/mobilization nuclease domain-containing protein [Nostoc sp.]|uniref:relaxase/mobilization nuclease domain-containing protein n=1 Tax=Nostoc sp. TaxID=1180 RepID=UPI00359355EB